MFESLQLKQENVLMYMTKMKISELEKYSVVKHYNATNETCRHIIERLLNIL